MSKEQTKQGEERQTRRRETKQESFINKRDKMREV